MGMGVFYNILTRETSATDRRNGEKDEDNKRKGVDSVNTEGKSWAMRNEEEEE